LEYGKIWKGEMGAREEPGRDVFITLVPNLVSKILNKKSFSAYDAILVDEGQDFHPKWWDILRKLCKPDGEMLLVADMTQDIYGTSSLWTESAMLNSGFHGKWIRLKRTYRLPPGAITAVSKFATQFLPKNTIDIPSQQGEFELEPCYLKWVHTSPDKACSICVEEILSMLTEAKSIVSIHDIVFLSVNHEFGLDVCYKLFSDTGIKAFHTYSLDSQESRRLKLVFYMGDARIKATTLHSFKGWETRLLIIYITHIASREDLALVYTALTRLKGHPEGSYLTVVSCAENLKDYAKSTAVWKYIEKFN
jgi:hypothetical protein